MIQYSKPDRTSALQAKFDALKIAFAPIIFQVTYALLKLDILKLISDRGNAGISAEEISKQLKISLYGVKVLLDV